MTNKIINRPLEITLPIAVVIIVVISVVIGMWTNEPHWLNRGGAAISAVSAGAVFFQISTELKIEEERKNLEHAAAALEKSSTIEISSPKGCLELKLIRNRLSRIGMDLNKTRLKVVKYVITSTMFGEILHGYGDLGMCFLLLSCPAP